MKFKKNTISAKQNTHVNNTKIKESNNIITKQTHVVTCFPFGITTLLYVLSSTIFNYFSATIIYLFCIEPISKTTYVIPL